MEIIIGQRYRHWKNGKVYKVVGLVLNASNYLNGRQELLVIYCHQAEMEWARPYSEFVELVAPGVPRFKLVEDESA